MRLVDFLLVEFLISGLCSAGSTIDECTSLHERWRQYHRQWFFTSLTDSELKVSQAEDLIRRVRSHQQQAHDDAYPQRKLRSVLPDVFLLSEVQPL
jgi:hypothetical protein